MRERDQVSQDINMRQVSDCFSHFRWYDATSLNRRVDIPAESEFFIPTYCLEAEALALDGIELSATLARYELCVVP